MTLLKSRGPSIRGNSSIVRCELGDFTEIGDGCFLSNVSLGNYSYCERFCDIANTEIGKFSNIASFARIGPTDHPMNKASLHHFLYRSGRYWAHLTDDQDFLHKREARTTRIGHDTWIGHAAIIKPEINIGDGAVIGAGSVVTHDVAPYTIVAGNPAKVIRRRFEEEITNRLARLSWWNWDHKIIGERLNDFRNLDIDSFLDKYENEK
jgi:phosphonate metabolism protein (transferase hexapeptide repeat family)